MHLRLLLLIIAVIPLGADAGDRYRLHISDEAAFFRSISRVESTHNNNKVGDRTLKYHAYGAYQIRYPYLQDVNRIARKDVLSTWGHRLTPTDMRDPVKAKWAMKVYLSYYGRRYTRITGKLPTATIYAKIHNGGPDGWRDHATRRYARLVVAYYLQGGPYV